MNYLTENELRELSKGSSIYWKTWHQRWGYMSYVIEQLKKHDPKKILEAGANGVPLCKDSVELALKECEITNKKGYMQDLNQIPYLFDDKEFDFFVALQVWEHLSEPVKAFNEIKRISKNIILSLPYMWNTPGNCHHGIDDSTVLQWSSGLLFSYAKLIRARKVYVWLDI
jgi:SAM-dependent methyltransferase